MSKMPIDFIDPDFWEWYISQGPYWLVSHRLDILNTMYEAYEDGGTDVVVMNGGDNFSFVGTSEELEEFIGSLQTLLGDAKSPRKNRVKPKSKPIANSDIAKLRKVLNDFKFKKED